MTKIQLPYSVPLRRYSAPRLRRALCRIFRESRDTHHLVKTPPTTAHAAANATDHQPHPTAAKIFIFAHVFFLSLLIIPRLFPKRGLQVGNNHPPRLSRRAPRRRSPFPTRGPRPSRCTPGPLGPSKGRPGSPEPRPRAPAPASPWGTRSRCCLQKQKDRTKVCISGTKYVQYLVVAVSMYHIKQEKRVIVAGGRVHLSTQTGPTEAS